MIYVYIFSNYNNIIIISILSCTLMISSGFSLMLFQHAKRLTSQAFTSKKGLDETFPHFASAPAESEEKTSGGGLDQPGLVFKQVGHEDTSDHVVQISLSRPEIS